jgi:hypothetical protein
MLRQRELPPQAFDSCELALVLDGFPELLVELADLGRGRLAIPEAG